MDSPTGGNACLYSEARTALKDLTGRADADFRAGQFDAISALVEQQRRVLVVQRTGWGKSAVYFLSALLQRRRGAGPALIISRSEEHTSELQSRGHLVCRLLLEKKKII